jgi:hypothetical protein
VSGEPWIILVENGNEFFLLYGVVKSFVIQLVLSSFFYKKIKIQIFSFLIIKILNDNNKLWSVYDLGSVIFLVIKCF